MKAIQKRPSLCKCEEAEQRAYEEHYKSDWIDDVDEDDLRDLTRQLWSILLESNDEPRDKYFMLKGTMESYADRHCQRFVEKNAEDYLEG